MKVERLHNDLQENIATYIMVAQDREENAAPNFQNRYEMASLTTRFAWIGVCAKAALKGIGSGKLNMNSSVQLNTMVGMLIPRVVGNFRSFPALPYRIANLLMDSHGTKIYVFLF